MKVTLIRFGKLHLSFAQHGYDEYAKRLQHYCKFTDELLVPKGKTNEPEKLKKLEEELLLKKIQATDFLVLLDERGKTFSSLKLATQLQNWLNHQGHIVFVIGGAYGFSEAVYARANFQISLSALTYSHQLVPMLFAEQLYRSFSILKGEPYHHE